VLVRTAESLRARARPVKVSECHSVKVSKCQSACLAPAGKVEKAGVPCNQRSPSPPFQQPQPVAQPLPKTTGPLALS
jgi:hypothetical protein